MIGVLLAAGFSRRFGTHNKLLQLLPDGTSIAFKAAQNLILALPNSVAVLRPDNKALGDALISIGFNVVFCTEAQQTMADSLALGIQFAEKLTPSNQSTQGYVIALGDMPFIMPNTILSVAQHLNTFAEIVVPTYEGKRGHPVAFSNKFKTALKTLSGDQGARTLLQRHAAHVHFLPCEDAGILQDIDTPEDLMKVHA